MNTYRIGIIGFGFIGKVHAYGYRNLPLFYDPVPLEAQISHVITSRPETAEKARRVLGASSAATDYREVTENPTIDIVHICTPNSAHKDALISAIRHQKHIFCDKPLVASGEEADQVEAALAGYRGIAQMTFHNRFFPAMIHARRLVEQGALGQVLQFRARLPATAAPIPMRAAVKLWRPPAVGRLPTWFHVLDDRLLIGPFESFQAAAQIAFRAALAGRRECQGRSMRRTACALPG